MCIRDRAVRESVCWLSSLQGSELLRLVRLVLLQATLRVPCDPIRYLPLPGPDATVFGKNRLQVGPRQLVTNLRVSRGPSNTLTCLLVCRLPSFAIHKAQPRLIGPGLPQCLRLSWLTALPSAPLQ